MRAQLLGLLLALGLAVPAWAAGSVSVTSTPVGSGIVRYDIAWTSSSGGAVSGNVLNIRRGHIVQVEFVPGATTPTDLYDVLLNDSHGVDLLVAGGADLSNSTSKILTFQQPTYYDQLSSLDLVIANAGNAKTGTVIVLVGP